MGFVKLDSGMLDSTLWMARTQREIFITALLMAEPYELEVSAAQIEVNSLKETGFMVPPGWYGFVPAAGVGIIARALVAQKEGLDALEALGSPEELSRSQDFDGRRLVRVDGGYIVLNYMKYRDRDYTTADRSRRYRERKKLRESHRDVTASHRDITQAEAEAYLDLNSTKQNRVSTSSSSNHSSADDDVEKILSVYKFSPATAGRVSPKDRDTAADLLKSFSVEQIEVGILLASARRNGNGKISSLAYFRDAIAESAVDPNMTGEYVEYLRRTIKKRHVEAK
jgi:hypothetical protein